MAAWTDETKAAVIKAYTASNPTAETSIEIIKEIAEEYEQTPNGVRMILVKANVYVKKDASAASKGATKEGGTRVSKEAQLDALKAALKDNGLPIDEEILDKLTGKAAAYFVSVIKLAVADE